MKASFYKAEKLHRSYSWRKTNILKEEKPLKIEETLGSFLYRHYDRGLQHYVNMQLKIPVSL